jgi:hypothetical protein
MVTPFCSLGVTQQAVSDMLVLFVCYMTIGCSLKYMCRYTHKSERLLIEAIFEHYGFFFFFYKQTPCGKENTGRKRRNKEKIYWWLEVWLSGVVLA